MTAALHCPCEERLYETAWVYDEPPEGETRFEFSGEGYRREVLRCAACEHYISRHDFDPAAFYRDEYVESTYGDRLRETFERITALPPERSDNHWRVERVAAFAREHLGGVPEPSVLDVGSGLCVFLNGLKEQGFRGTALDPDPRTAEHAREIVGVEAVCADYMEAEDLGRFDVIAFNKVLEHVQDPVAMLARSSKHLAEGGFVYVEVPDGPAAAEEGPGREEFFVEHLHVFSPASLALTAERAGFSPVRIDRFREPSTKFTLAAFLIA